MTQKQIQVLVLNGPDVGLVVTVTPDPYTYRLEKLTHNGKVLWAGSAYKDLTVSQMFDLAINWGWVDNEGINYAADHFSEYQA